MNTKENNPQLLQSNVSVSVTDLRIGNLIQKNGVLCTVELINGETEEIYFLGKDIYYSDNVMYIEPISLTEEWLLNLGFKPFQKDFSKKGMIIHTRKRGFIVRKSIPEIKTVHQLQNLYYALTNEELIIKL